MKKVYLLMALFATGLQAATAQKTTTLDFENPALSKVDTFADGKGGPGQFTTQNTQFKSVYIDFGGGFYDLEGYFYSSKKDSTTAGYANTFSARPAKAYSGNQYLLARPTQSTIVFKNGPVNLKSLQITNTTYAALSMANGDAFAKKFGGASGTDPDFFFARWYGYSKGKKSDSLDFYLADFRSANSNQDYILKDWKKLNFNWKDVDSINFQLFTSDVGSFGGNTPTYLAMDDLIFQEVITALENTTLATSNLKFYPNPTVDVFYINSDKESDKEILSIRIYNLQGQDIKSFTKQETYNISDLQSGTYLCKVFTTSGIQLLQLVKI